MQGSVVSPQQILECTESRSSSEIYISGVVVCFGATVEIREINMTLGTEIPANRIQVLVYCCI